MSPLFLLLLAMAFALIALIIWAYYKKTARLIAELREKLALAEQHLKIAEENFYTRKMSQQVFENILRDFKAQMIEIELKINQLKSNKKIDVQERLKTLGAKIKKPTKAQIHKLEKLLTETEGLLTEISFLHNKLLKREIDEKLFTQLSEEKHKNIIKAEAKIRSLIKTEEKTSERASDETKKEEQKPATMPETKNQAP